MAYYLGIDVGGTHITLDLVDTETFEVKKGAELRRPFDTHVAPTAVLGVFDSSIREIVAKVGADEVKGIGFAFPGPFNYAEGICRITPAQKKYDLMFGVNFRQYLCHALSPDKPLVFNNDAASFALGEYFKGGARGFKRAVVVTLGTGFGASFLKDGRPCTSGPDVPKYGELWYIPYKTGIADDFFTTRWLVGEWKRETGKEAEGGKEIAQKALKGDAVAKKIYREFGANLAEFVAPWLTKFGAEAFVIGGNLARDWDLFVPAFEAALSKRMKNGIAVKPCEMGEQASVCGAALSVTLMKAADVVTGGLPAGAADAGAIAERFAGAKLAVIDGPAGAPFKEVAMAVDKKLRAAGRKAVWFDVSAAVDDETGAFDKANLANIRPDAAADLNVAYGAGAGRVPWGGAVAVTL